MSVYALNKMIRTINRNPDARAGLAQDASKFTDGFELSQDERAAFLAMDIHKLYTLGVHGLILRPFTIIKGMPEREYLDTIRGAN